MITLEQVKLLETKVSKAIDTIQHLTEENRLLREKLEGYQNRINELEVFIQRFKDDQSKIEAGIISALDRLNKFEDILELELQVKQNKDTAGLSKSSEVDSAVADQHSSYNPSPDPIPVQQTTIDPNSDEAILAILEQEEKARQNTVSAHSVSGTVNNQTASGAELDIF